MSIKKSFIPLLTMYAIIAVMMSTNCSNTLIYLFGILIFISYYIYSKDKNVSFKTKLFIVILYFMIYIFFFFYSNIVYSNINKDQMHNDRKYVVLTGYISDLTKHEEDSEEYLLVSDNGYKYNIIISNSYIQIGDIVKITGKVYKPNTPGNKGQFNYRNHSYSKNISADIYVNKVNILILGYKSIPRFLGKIRSWAVDRVMLKLKEDKIGIATALITGSYVYIDNNTKEIFQKSGLSHILSISGTHFNILILPIYSIFALLCKNKRISLIITIIFIILLLVFTGARVGAIRSALSLITIYLCRFFFLDSNKLLPICFSVLVIIFLNPLSIFDTGFIMSYACVLSIYIFSDKIRSIIYYLINKIKVVLDEKIFKNHIILEDYYRRIKSSIIKKIMDRTVSVMSFLLSIQPLMILITYRLFLCIYPYSLISNMLTFLLIIPLLISLWLGIIIPTIFCPVFSFLSSVLIKIASYICYLPFSKFYIKHIPDLIFLTLITVYVLIKFKILKTKILKLIMYMIACISCFITLLVYYNTKVVFLDVGQGDSTIITTASGYSILIDTGKYIESSCLAFYTGNKINTIILTHSDSDHSGYIMNILNDFKIENIYLPDTLDIANINLFNEIRSNYPDVNINLVKRGDFIEDSNIYIKVLNPNPQNEYTDVNDSSIVFSLYTESCSILFTADADLKKIPLDNFIKCDIIKIPHHGDSSVIDENCLQYISPSVGIISVGRYNSYGHPEKKTLEYLHKMNVKVLRTDIDGSITIYMLNKKYYVYKYR